VNVKSTVKVYTGILWLFAFGAGAADHQVVRVSAPDAERPAEVSVAINPTNPDNIIATSFQYPGGAGNGSVYVSHDGGGAWRTILTPNPQKLRQGDPSVAFSSNGDAYHAFLPFIGIREERPERAYSGIHIESSQDGGLTWSDAVPVVAHVNTTIPFEDKHYVVTDSVAGSPNLNNVYLAWTRFDDYGSDDPDCETQIYFSRSTNGGEAFSMPIRISDQGGNCVDSDDTVEGAIAAVGPGGGIYVVWSGPNGLVFDQSLDGGLTFGEDKLIGPHPGGWDISIPGLNRCNGMPVTRVDVSDGPHRGTIHVNWVDDRNGDPDVFVMSSKDGGETWSDPVRVNDDALGNGAAQFLTWMAVDPVDGSVNVVFYDRRDLNGTETAVTLARSIDGGRTFANHRIDLPAFSCNEEVFFGDYNGIDAYGGLVVPIFTHFISDENLAVSAAVFRFNPGTHEIVTKAKGENAVKW